MPEGEAVLPISRSRKSEGSEKGDGQNAVSGLPAPTSGRRLNPLLIIIAMVLLSASLTFVIPAGRFVHEGQRVIATSYHAIPKVGAWDAIATRHLPSADDPIAQPTGPIAFFSSLPAGMVKSASLFFMVMFVGGAFGILRATGAVDAGIDRLLYLMSGNVYLLSAVLLILLACGSTFLGFSSEYVALVPIVWALGRRLGLPNLYAVAIVAMADFIGYGVSVTNPIVLGVAQPVAGVPMFSGFLPRFLIFVAFLVFGLVYVLNYVRRQPRIEHIPDAAPMAIRQICVLITLVIGACGLILGTSLWSWETPQLTAAFLALSVALPIAGGIKGPVAADAFLEGMAVMLLPCLLIGFAASIGIILQSSQVLDTIVHWIALSIKSDHPGVVAIGLVIAEMGFGLLIPSASAKAAVSLPILAPIAHLSGLNGQITVTALLLGSAMTNFVSPNPLLLAFLAAARVGYVEWVKFVWPIVSVFTVISFAAIYLMASLGV